MKKLCVLLRLSALLIGAMFSGEIGAHGGLSMEKDACKLKVGPYYMHFTGFQPESTQTKEFCEDIPATGHTIVVLDYVDEQLRDMPTEVRIIEDTGSEQDLKAITLLHVPAKVYPAGSLNFEYRFDKPGKYVGLVTVGAKQEYVSRFPFAVGARNGLWQFALIALAAVAVGVGLYIFSGRRRNKPDTAAV